MANSFQNIIFKCLIYATCIILLFQCDDKNAPNSPDKIKGQWIKINNGFTDHHIQAMTIDPNNPNVLLVASFRGIFKSTDSGSSWQLSNTGLLSKDVKVLVADPLNSNRFYAGSWGTGIYCTEDGGTNWRAINNGITDKRIRGIVIHHDSTNQIYAASETEFMKSNDAGKMWSATKWPFGNISALAVDFQNNIMYVGTGFNGIYRSDDGGASWVSVNNGLPRQSNNFFLNIDILKIDLSQTNRIWTAVEGSGIYMSENSGQSWQRYSAGLTGWFHRCLINHKTDENILIVATSDGVFLSRDMGKSWDKIIKGIENKDIRALALRYDPLVAYAGTMGDGVYQYIF